MTAVRAIAEDRIQGHALDADDNLGALDENLHRWIEEANALGGELNNNGDHGYADAVDRMLHSVEDARGTARLLRERLAHLAATIDVTR